MATMLAKTVVATMVQNAELEWGTGGAAQDTTSLDFSKVGSPWLKGDVHVVVKSN
jgi:sterol 14-demethylase